MNIEKAIEYIEKDPIAHADMLLPIHRGTAEILYASHEGVLLRESKSGIYFMSVDNLDLGKELFELVEKGEVFSLHQEFMFDYIKEEANYENQMKCHQKVYTRKEKLQVDSKLTIKQLGIEYLDIVFDNYHAYRYYDYLKERIESGEMYGGFIEDKLCGFVGMHQEGSIGLLEILEEHRQKGYATILESFIINLVLEKGLMPYGHVTVGNDHSLKLQEKLGMVTSKQTIYWLF